MEVYPYKLKNGKTMYEVYFVVTDAKGVKTRMHKKGFSLKREALNYAREQQQLIAKQSPDFVRGLCEAYLKDGKARLKPTTYKNRVYFINSVVLPYFGEYRITDVTAQVVREWENELLEDEHEYSDTYLRAMQARLSALFNYAVRYFKLPQNPVPLAGAIGKSHREHFDFWTLDEFNTFKAKFLEDSKFTQDHLHRKVDRFVYYVAFMLLFHSGMRNGEMLALTVGDVNPDTCMVSINKNYAVVDGKELILTPKTPKSKRVIKLSKDIIKLLLELKDKLPDQSPTTRFFAGLNKHSLRLALQGTAERAGLKKIRVHDLRHSHASMLVYNGVPFMDIRDRLGHEKMETTLNLYSHLYPERRDAIGDLLDKLTE